MTLSAADRLDILDLLSRADTAAGARDAAAYLALFTPDAVLDGDQGTYRGARALAAGVAAVWAAEPAGTLHLTLNPVIDAAPGEEPAAVARSVLLMIDPGPPPALVHTAHITQHLHRDAGGWRIARRTVGTQPAGPAATQPRPEA